MVTVASFTEWLGSVLDSTSPAAYIVGALLFALAQYIRWKYVRPMKRENRELARRIKAAERKNTRDKG